MLLEIAPRQRPRRKMATTCGWSDAAQSRWTTSGASPWIHSAQAATSAASMQWASRRRSTERTEWTVSPASSWLAGIALTKAWMRAGVASRARRAKSPAARPKSARRARRRRWRVLTRRPAQSLAAGAASPAARAACALRPRAARCARRSTARRTRRAGRARSRGEAATRCARSSASGPSNVHRGDAGSRGSSAPYCTSSRSSPSERPDAATSSVQVTSDCVSSRMRVVGGDHRAASWSSCARGLKLDRSASCR